MLHFKNSYKLSMVPSMKGMIIFLHGVTSSKDEEVFQWAESFFNGEGYSTFRFNFYGDWIYETSLQEESLKSHIDDTDMVIDYFFRQWIDNIILIGHSFWWLVSLYIDTNKINTIVLWDASIWWSWLLEDVVQWDDGQYYIDWWDWYKHYINDHMYYHFTISPDKHKIKLSNLYLPIKIIVAEHGLSKAWEEYFSVANEPKEFSVILGAEHTFEDKNSQQQLFEETLDWIKKY